MFDLLRACRESMKRHAAGIGSTALLISSCVRSAAAQVL
jgi:hypothetical protein